MNKIKLALSSRTVWTLIVLFIINGIAGIHDSINPTVLNVLDPILGILAIYFKVNTSTDYRG